MVKTIGRIGNALFGKRQPTKRISNQKHLSQNRFQKPINQTVASYTHNAQPQPQPATYTRRPRQRTGRSPAGQTMTPIQTTGPTQIQTIAPQQKQYQSRPSTTPPTAISALSPQPRALHCPMCGELFTQEMMEILRQRGKTFCEYCGNELEYQF